MLSRNELKDPAILIRVGMLFLLLASLSKWFWHPSASVPADLADGITGLLYGVSIGCLLLGSKGKRRRQSQ